MLFAVVVGGITAFVVYFFAARTWWFPLPISRHAAAFDAQFLRTLWIAGVVFTLAQLVLAAAASRFRGHRARSAYFTGSRRAEVLWGVASAALFLGITALGTRLWATVHFDAAPPNAIPIEVLGRQFAWTFRYPGPDGRFGRTDLALVNDAAGNPTGLDQRDPAAKDDIVSASLKIPAGQPVRLILRSRDVIHSFFVPELRLRQDLVPGMDIPLHFQADRIGVYEIPCSELCGLGHFQMRASMQVMSASDFAAWERRQAGER